MELGPTDHCFVCGMQNPRGLRLEFTFDADEGALETTWRSEAAFQGYDGVLHGGLIATVLDEAVGKLSVLLGKPALTAEMSVRYLKPVPTGAPLKVRGRITEERSRLLLGEAQAYLPDGTLAAQATVKLVRTKT